ncbi:MAG: hypothetical protein LBK01_07020 [Burkholderiaceae bacterium]|jgi:hypothetical protein|nr:hypothetical protein [Burkholderiaceae bacterium]
MKPTDAASGLRWIREGFQLFRRRPFLFSNLFFAYLMLLFVVGRLPFLGSVLPPLLLPCFAVFFLQTIHEVSENHRPIRPMRLFSLFSRPVTGRLLALGCLHLISSGIAVYASSLMDGGIFMRTAIGMQQEITPATMPLLVRAFLVFSVINILTTIALWFVAPLTAWKSMPLGQALFYNFFTLLRIWKSFIVYIVGCLLFGLLIPMLVSTLLDILLGRIVSQIFAISILMLDVVWVYCTFYCMYVDIFGPPASVVEPIREPVQGADTDTDPQ